MAKAVSLFFIGLLLTISVQGQSWTRLKSWGLNLETIYWANDSLGFAAGEDLFIQTQNAGLSWRELSYIPDERILDLIFINELIGIAIGENGSIIKTTDGGLNWEEKSSGTGLTLNNISSIGENVLLAVGNNGLILNSMDQGESWSIIQSGISENLNDVFIQNSDTIYVVGNQGKLIFSEDGSQTWNSLSTGVTSDLNGIKFSSTSIGYIAGDLGIVLKTTDGGSSWTPLISNVSTNLNKITSSPTNAAIITVIGEEATALRSTNSGASFSKANLGNGNTKNLTSLTYRGANNQIFATGSDGYLIVSSNGGASWQVRLDGIRNDFSGTDFKTDRYGFISGERGFFYLTGNAGVSLINRSLPEEVDIVSLDFWNTNFGYVSGPEGNMFRTGNAGRSWVPVKAETPEQINGFYLFAPSVAYISGTNGYIGRSFDSGGTWDANIETATSEGLKDITFFDFQVGFAMGDNGQISWSNGGNVWETLPKLTEENLNALAKVDSSTAVIVGDGGIILKSEDKALTWRKISVPFVENINSVDFWDDKLGLAVGDNGFTIQTKNGGETWTRIPSGTRFDLSGVSIANPLVAYAVGEKGTFLNYICTPPGALSEISGPASSCLTIQEYQIDKPAIEGAFIEWRVDGGTIISGQGTNKIQVEWTETGRNAVLVSNENFCGNGETSFMEIDVTDVPSQNWQITGNGSVCTQTEENYRIQSLEGVTYTWEVSGGSIISGQGSSEISVLWEEVAEQQVQVTLENTCGETEPIILAISVNEAPSQPSEITGEELVGLGESSYEITETEGVNYQWSISGEGGRILSGQGTGTVTVLWEQEGNYELKVTPQNSCENGESRSFNVEVNIITALEPDAGLNELVISPNPSNGTIRVRSDFLNNWTEIILINPQGNTIQSKIILPGSKEIRFENLPSGLVFVQILGRNSVEVRKIIVR